MTDQEYDELFERLMQMLFSDPPPDDRVKRHATGLLKAIHRFQVKVGASKTSQVRIGSPRHSGLASMNATLASTQEKSSG